MHTAKRFAHLIGPRCPQLGVCCCLCLCHNSHLSSSTLSSFPLPLVELSLQLATTSVSLDYFHDSTSTVVSDAACTRTNYNMLWPQVIWRSQAGEAKQASEARASSLGTKLQQRQTHVCMHTNSFTGAAHIDWCCRFRHRVCCMVALFTQMAALDVVSACLINMTGV